MTVEILQIDEVPQAADAFYALPDQVYLDDGAYIPTPIEKTRAEVERADQAFVAMKAGRAVARCVAYRGKPGRIGCFEALEDADAVRALLDAASEWLTAQGADAVIGPINGDTWHSYRFNLGPWERPPFMLEPYNAVYYPQLWKAAGFEPFATYYSKFVGDSEAARDNLCKYRQRCLKNGFSFRSFDLDHLQDELRILYDLSCQIFSKNFMYTDISFEDFAALYSDAKPILKEDLAFFCLDADGNYAGYAFCTPDYFEALRRMDGRRNLLGKLAFLINRHKAETLNIKTIGTLPAYRRTGLGAALMCEAFDRGLAAGFAQANMCLIHETNASGRLDGGQGEVMRQYALYRRELTE